MKKLESLKFDNLALRALPVDKNETNYTRQVENACFSLVEPTPVENPQLVCASVDALKLIAPDITEEDTKAEQFVRYFSGNEVLPGARPAAHCYCGHQFGYFSGQLGDGATMYLGEVVSDEGERWEIQFKGAGKTPFSRTADGRKVLRSSLREFLCSEAMHYLGVPTTRAGTVVTSDSRVVRDIFYTGNIVRERCSIVLRLAPSFIRFGSFEIFKEQDSDTGRAGPSVGNVPLLETLTNYCIDAFYCDVAAAHPNYNSTEDSISRYKAFFAAVVDKTIDLVVHWQRVGFCHGVLNTDNMSIVGVTIDYGPFGFLESYDPDYICNGSDKDGRYSFSEQPKMCKWNCGKLAEALAPILPPEESQQVLASYDQTYNERYNAMMLKKIGLYRTREDTDSELVSELLSTMEQTGADWTATFSLITQQSSFEDIDVLSRQLVAVCASLEHLASRCLPRFPPEHLAKLVGLAQSNPSYLQMMGVEPATVFKDVEKMKRMRKLQDMTEDDLQKKQILLWSKWLHRYAERVQREYAEPDASSDERRRLMRAQNPVRVLRNSVAQRVIDAAEGLDFEPTHKLLEMLQRPCEILEDNPLDWQGPAEWDEQLVVT